MDDESLTQYLLDKAQECIAASESDIKLGHLSSAGNRSYYAVYNAMRAILNLTNFKSKALRTF